MALFDFLGRIENRVSSVANFWEVKEHDLPEKSGVYILIAKRGMLFRYPRGKSPIYYIGQSNLLKHRLYGHWRWHDEVRRDKRTVFPLYEARHEYGGKFGGRYCFIQTRQGQSPKKLEEKVLALFAKSFNTFPVGNSAGAWNRIKNEFRSLK